MEREEGGSPLLTAGQRQGVLSFGPENQIGGRREGGGNGLTSCHLTHSPQGARTTGRFQRGCGFLYLCYSCQLHPERLETNS